MRVATFNVLSGRTPGEDHVDAGRFAAAVAALDADVLALQEVDRGQPRSGYVDLAGVAAAAGGAVAHRFAAAMTGLPGGSWTPTTDADPADAPAYGIALLSRHPVTDWQVVRLPPLPVRMPYRWPGARRLSWVHDEQRVALLATVASPLGPLRVAATHVSFLRLSGTRTDFGRDEPDPLEGIASTERPHDETLAGAELQRTIRKLIAALPHKLRDALLLAGSGEHTYEQIGVLLGAPVGTVKWRVSEARRILRMKLERQQPGS